MGRSGFKMARRIGLAVGIAAMSCLLATGLLRAQDASPQPAGQQSARPPAISTPPGPVNPIGSQDQSVGTVEQTPTQAPDTRPLAGAQELTPSLAGSGRSYVIPSFSVWEGADSNAQLAPGVTQYAAATIPVGSLALNYSGRANQFSLDYGGGGIIYNNGVGQSSTFQDATIGDFYNARRWNLLMMDRVTYFPEASLGFGGLGYAGVFNTSESLGLGSGMSPMSQFFVPGQSILLGRVGTASNNAILQAQYFVTPTTSVSGVASFGIQHYDQANLASGNNRIFVGSIDHQLTPTNTVTFAYDLVQYRYNGGSTEINDNIFQFGYSHRVTSRLSILAIGGPAVIYSAFAGIPGTQQKWNWTGQFRAMYRTDRDSLYLSYLHYQTPGSGLYEGAQTDTATAGFSRQLTRTWTGFITATYAHNTQLVTSPTSPNPTNSGPTDYESGSIRLSHTMGRHMRIFGVYALEHQQGNVVVMGNNGTKIFRQIFGIGIEMHPRPFSL